MLAQHAADAVLDQALLRALAALALLGALRLGLPLALSAAGALPGAAGRLASRAGHALRPGLLRRLVAITLGLAAPASPTLVAHAASAPPVTAEVRGQAPTAHLPSTAASGPWVVVAPGDTLWALARSHLRRGASDAEIARAWPRWYAANRSTIGPDPNLISPGMRLRAPGGRPLPRTGPRPAGTPAPHHRPASTPTDATSLDPDRR